MKSFGIAALLASIALGLTALPAATAQEDYEPGHSWGPEDAPLTIIEYGSLTCSGCQFFHKNLMPVIETYIEAGKVRFVYREVLRNDLDTALASLARCTGSENYFDVIGSIYDNQGAILEAAGNGQVMSQFIAIGTPYGITDEAAFNGCYGDMNIRFELIDVEQSALDYDLRGTPTLIINGEEKYVGPDMESDEAFTAFLDKTLAALEPDAADQAH